jgi:tetratricopeptide (TPR) repeat protein
MIRAAGILLLLGSGAFAQTSAPEAEAAWLEGDLERAGRLIREYVRDHPEGVRSPRVAALLARTAEDPAEAIGRWEEVIAMEPEAALVAEAHWHRGIQAYSAGLYVAAGQAFARLAEDFTDEFDRGRAFLWKGYAALGAVRVEQAYESFREAEREARDPHDVRSAKLGMAHASFRIGTIGEALRRYERFERDHPDDGRASAAARRAVECLRLLGRESLAARAAVRIEREYPDSREATLARAEVRSPPDQEALEPRTGEGEDGDKGEVERGTPHLVQVAALSDPRNVATLRRRILRLGIGPIRVEPGESPEGPVHRILLGPYDTEEEARVMADSVATLGDVTPRVREVTAPR